MLSYIWQQHCRIIAFSRCLIVKCGVTPLKVVGVNILSNGSSGFFDVIILCQIDFFILEATKPALNHDIIRPAAFSIHALADAVFFYEINVLLTGKLTSLVRIQYLWFGYLKCFFQSIDDHSGIKRIINFPADNTATVPVDNSCQI